MHTIVKLAAIFVTAFSAAASAAEIEVKSLNRGASGVMVFEPAYVEVQPGDTVKFVATDKGHNAESIQGMLPDGATSFIGKTGEDVAVTFDKPGLYGIRCKPHYGMGMVAIVVVGKPDNLDQAKSVNHPGKAKAAFAALFAKVGNVQAAGD